LNEAIVLGIAASVSSEPDTGGKERKYMNNTTKYSDAPANIEESLEDAEVIGDFLPTPDKLLRISEKERITIAVDKGSLELYKLYAKKHNTKYQSMMNGVLISYAEKFLRK
jgi:hypothetical protein